MHDIEIFPDSQALTIAALELFLSLGNQAIKSKGSFSVALSGGSTPKALYQQLGDSKNQNMLAWENVHLFWGDERYLSFGDSNLNYSMVKETLLDHLNLPEENICRVPVEMEVRLAAFSYEEELRRFFDGEWPEFDLILLGMGDDGHTASLFPKSAGLNEEHRWFIANQLPKEQNWRLTLTKNAVNHASNILVLVQGRSKANMLKEVLIGPYDPINKPIQLISPHQGKLLWFIDEEAASQLLSDDPSR